MHNIYTEYGLYNLQTKIWLQKLSQSVINQFQQRNLSFIYYNGMLQVWLV